MREKIILPEKKNSIRERESERAYLERERNRTQIFKE
jgi:hypothetical protein